jgi:hypothetical protein
MATVARLAILALGLLPWPAAAQDRPETDTPPPARPVSAPDPLEALAEPPPPTDLANPPSPAIAIQAFTLVESWVRAAAVPEPPDPAAIPRTGGAAIVLRQNGEVVGRGVDLSDDGLALWRAARAAWTEASARVQVERDALMEASLKQAAATLTISLELAGAPTPLLGDTYADLAAEIDPGLTGLAVRAGDRIHAIFPATMLATGTTPDEAFGIALLEAFDGDKTRVMDDRLALLPPDSLRQHESVAYLKFKVSHLAQWSPNSPPTFLHRSSRIVGRDEITVPGMRTFADGMARHLLGRAWPGPDAYGMFGRLEPATGRYDPRFADAAEQAAAALALRRYSDTRGVDRTTADAARDFARDLLTALAKVERDEIAPWNSPASAAACIVAYLEGGRPLAADEVRMAGLLPQCVAMVDGAFDAPSGFAESVPPSARGLVAWALVRAAIDSGDQAGRAKAQAAIRAVYTSTAPEMLVGQWPWLGWAELELAGPPGFQAEVPAAVALRDTRELVWKHQLRSADLESQDADFEGGIVFTKSRFPLPGWNTARPLAFLATMLGDPRLTTPEERPAELVRMIEGIRFLRQLAVEEPSTFMFKGPAKRTLGGVRAAPWDIRMPPDATSLSLLTLCEALRSLDAMAPAGQR